MKKIAALFLAVMVLTCSAVPALAAVNLGTVPLMQSPLGQAGCVVEEDGWEYVQTFIVSTLTAEQLALYEKFKALPDNRKMIVADYSKSYVTLVIPAANAKISGNASSGHSIKMDGYISFSSSKGSLTYFSMVSGSDVNFALSSVTGSFSPFSVYLVMGRDFAQDIVNGTSPNPNVNFLKHYQTWTTGIGWRDDIEEEPSEPEPPPMPSEPEPDPIPPWVPGGPPPPSTGSKSPYVPYDVSVWDDFTAYLRTASGSATNIILFIMIPFVVIPLIVTIFKHFASGGKSGGGGKAV